MSQTSAPALNQRLIRWSLSEIRHGQLWPISVALTLIIACVFALTALAGRMEQVVVKQGKDALTADSVFVSANPIPPALQSLTQQQSMTTSNMTRFATMAFSDNGMQLVTVKAVDSQYPIRGEMQLSDGKSIVNHLQPGQLWLDERIFSQLNVAIGDNVTIGDADFTVSGRIVEEPGLSFNPFQQMPSVFIHQQDVAKTGALQIGSRVSYSLFINGEPAQIEALKKAVELTPSDRWRDQNSASRTNEVFERTQQYLSLTVAIVIIMAATTLVLTCQHYVSTRQRTIAML
ncbi:MAG: ABC transporter permease, partial [Vibrionaceae bacterium]